MTVRVTLAFLSVIGCISAFLHPQHVVGASTGTQLINSPPQINNELFSEIHHNLGSFMISYAGEQQATIQPYTAQPLPFWVAGLSVALVVVTIAVPQIARKRQLAKNTRVNKDESRDGKDGKSIW
jgi:hypothetical protein